MSLSRSYKAAILASGQLMTSVAGLVSLAVLARILTVSDYATYRQTILAYSFASPLLMLGLHQALYYFLPGEKDRARGVLLENLLLLTLMGGVFSLFLLLGGNQLLAWRFNNPALQKTLIIFAPYPLFMLPAATLSACLIAQNRVQQVAIFNIVSRVVSVMIILVISLIWRSPIAAITGTVLGAGVMLFPAIKMMLGATSGSKTNISKQGMWSQFKYSVPLGLAGMVGTIAFSLDKVLVASMCTPEQFAIYANGAMEIPLLSIVTGSVTAILLPELSQLFKEDRREEALALVKRSAVKCALILYPTMFILFFMAPEVISVIYSDKYVESVIPFRIYLILLPIRIMTYSSMIIAAGKSHLLLIRSIFDLLFIFILSIFFIKLIGYLGAAIASIITMYVWQMSFNTLVIAKEYRTKIISLYPIRELFKILIISCLSSIIFITDIYVRLDGSIKRLLIFVPIYSLCVFIIFVKFRLVNFENILSHIKLKR